MQHNVWSARFRCSYGLRLSIGTEFRLRCNVLSMDLRKDKRCMDTVWTIVNIVLLILACTAVCVVLCI